ncbi:GNAT family N-acetyltransferase [Mesorhizobium sp. M4B.F.Ca.ET.169.01.1.1]|uniref:acyl-homoserine-lactone synthase n=1 Tax=unclassified Mesorhizobium TaxID=325217 RepID=UPI000FC99EE9|nr:MULTISPECIES: acyl-homoserine-lactone synthase [unclassified Mesorhizobium]RVD46090.1 GNAT family N-acetyltransferase [Mesorhizobium sp. M4B.F.Ca.ET.019.03.1.1]TGT41912.1 GNAT family N-acetyltransferase [Mesorhizobium sp. M4B.F.Ca.ET.169.01.1.1]
MLHIVTAENFSSYQQEMDEAFRLRHKVFVDEKGWTELAQANGLETDRFDDEHAVHMLFIADSHVIGYQRMLPSTRPHLLTEVLSDLCESLPPAGPNIWEWTRYCVEAGHRERGRILSPVANALLTGIVEWGLGRGVDTIIIEMNPLWLLRLVQLHFRVTPLGLPRVIGGEETMAVTASFDKRTLVRLNDMRKASPRAGTVEN